MNANLDKWSAALRSGNYKQFRGGLVIPSYPPRFCCLGVKIHLETGSCSPGDAYASTLIESQARDFFVWLNDELQLSFEEIALVIDNVPEEEWYVEFVGKSATE